ncbi:hypothetical protein HPB47_026799 [Ixodes persulcatus]|uniref:Uncharacterized protein n=1 Tax=Ixodes persulcatus TaxID=34615 RepID=A0AC60PXM7_IXOPE|nr:hypothetical protein HPB47_026799 [Ixodes persulcatus]
MSVELESDPQKRRHHCGCRGTVRVAAGDSVTLRRRHQAGISRRLEDRKVADAKISETPNSRQTSVVGRVRPVRGAVGRRASPAPACVLTARKHVGGRSAARPARPTVVGIIRTKTSGGGRPARTPVRGEARRSSPQGCRASGRASNQHANAAAGLSSRAAAAGSLLAGRRVTPTARRPTSRPHVTVGQRHRQARRRKVARRTQFCLAPAAPANVYCSFSPPRSAYVRSTLGGPSLAGCWPTAYARRFSESAPTYFLSPGPRAACFVARPVADTPSAEVADELEDILAAAPTSNQYDNLKAAILTRKTASERSRLQHLLNMEELGDQRPSQLLRRMRQLLGDATSDADTSLLRELFLQRLPNNMVVVLAAAEDMPLERLADLADRVAEYSTPPVVAATSFQSRTSDPAAASPSQDIAARLSRLEKAIQDLQLPASRPSSSRRRSSSRRASPAAVSPDSERCW